MCALMFILLFVLSIVFRLSLVTVLFNQKCFRIYITNLVLPSALTAICLVMEGGI